MEPRVVGEAARCWVCGRAVADDINDFEPDGAHAHCLVIAQRIDDGLRHKPDVAAAPDWMRVRW